MGDSLSLTLLPALGTFPFYRVTSFCFNRTVGVLSYYNFIGRDWLIYMGVLPFPEEKGGGVDGVEQEGRTEGRRGKEGKL